VSLFTLRRMQGQGLVLAGWLLSVAGVAGAAEPPSPAGSPAVGSDAVLTAPTDEPAHAVRRHYLWSNERRHDLFFADIKEIGGGYLGVGGDQNYTLAAAANSTVMWLVDLDLAVVHMHRLYAALLPDAATAQDFLALFAPAAKATVHAALQARVSDPSERSQLLKTYHGYRELLQTHLRETVSASHGHTWLGDPAHYQRIRSLAAAGRLVARLGDLTGPQTMLQVAGAAKQSQTVVRAVYLSNAESWFGYGPAFRRNFQALPFDEKSVILRTIKSQLLRYPSGDIWHYAIQRATHFAENLGRPAYRTIDVAMTDAVLLPTSQAGVSHLGFAAVAGEKPLLPSGRQRTVPPITRSSLIAAGLVTRPAGNREPASEMDRDLKRRAELELTRSSQ
jgi:hypothetical protein